MESLKCKVCNGFKLRRKTLSFFGQNQYSDWKIILSIFVAGLFSSVCFGIFTYYDIGEDVDVFPTESAPVRDKKIKKEVFTSIINKIEERKVKFEELKTKKPVAVDPSF